MECSICLETIKEKGEYKLSCNHTFHKECYRKCVFSNDLNIFIDCPLCRDFNYNNFRSDDNLENLLFFCYKGRCCHFTKKGNRCKNKSSILNYGYCYTHNKEVLPKDKYELMVDFIYWIIEGNNRKETKLLMIDSGKKILIKHPDITKIQGILFYFYKFFNYFKRENNSNNPLINKKEMYHYYDLELPVEDWINRCLEKKVIY